MIRPGKILYQFYYRPIDVVGKTFRRGFWKSAQQNQGQEAMRKASGLLREITYTASGGFDVYFLTGKKYWFQTAFCLYSLQRSAGVNIHAVLVDDGSFDNVLEATIKKQFPSTSSIIRSAELTRFLNLKLPVEQYPVLRARRIVYPHIRKLTDVHVLPGDGPKLVLDSDMLFFHRPDALLRWFENPSVLLFMQDVKESYGYSRELMRELAGSQTIPHRLNVGVAGIPSSEIDWGALERWTDELLKREGSSYLQEQALTAMIAAKKEYQLLNEKKYKVLPKIVNTNIPEILHHYVADAKFDYFVKGWRLLVS